MSNKSRLFLTASLCVASGIGAGTEPADMPVLNGRVTAESWNELAADQRLQDCERSECIALQALVRTFAVLDRRDFPNSMAQGQPAARVTADHLPIADLSRTDGKAAPLACDELATIGKGVADLSVVLHALEVATLLVPFEPTCVRHVVRAVPEILDDTTVVPEARSLCQARHEPDCEQLNR